MGRRALRKIDPNLNVTLWYCEEEQLPEELPHPSLFGRSAPLEIEIGTGKGLFLRHATEMCPDHDFLGIEIRRKYARFAAAALAKRNRANGKLVHGEGGTHSCSKSADSVDIGDPCLFSGSLVEKAAS